MDRTPLSLAFVNFEGSLCACLLLFKDCVFVSLLLDVITSNTLLKHEYPIHLSTPLPLQIMKIVNWVN